MTPLRHVLHGRDSVLPHFLKKKNLKIQKPDGSERGSEFGGFFLNVLNGGNVQARPPAKLAGLGTKSPKIVEKPHVGAHPNAVKAGAITAETTASPLATRTGLGKVDGVWPDPATTAERPGPRLPADHAEISGQLTPRRGEATEIPLPLQSVRPEGPKLMPVSADAISNDLPSAMHPKLRNVVSPDIGAPLRPKFGPSKINNHKTETASAARKIIGEGRVDGPRIPLLSTQGSVPAVQVDRHDVDRHDKVRKEPEPMPRGKTRVQEMRLKTAARQSSSRHSDGSSAAIDGPQGDKFSDTAIDSSDKTGFGESGLAAFRPHAGIGASASPLLSTSGFTVPNQAGSVAAQIARSVPTVSGHETEIALDPVELGKVKLTLRTGENKMMVHIVADRAETLDLMRRNVGDLASEFQAMGYESVAFEFSGGGGDAPQDEGYQPSEKSAEFKPLQDLTMVQMATQPPVSVRDGTLDLRL